MDLSEIGAGFADISLGSQSVFRSALQALSHPGRAVTLDISFEVPKAAQAASSGLLLALLEPGSKLWLSPSLANTDAATWITFHTDCKITSDQRTAEFAWIKGWSELPPLESFLLGTDEYPDQSTTCVIDVEPADLSSSENLSLTLTGPGIARTTSLKQPGATKSQTEQFLAQWTKNKTWFPRGIDLFLSRNTSLIGLPRTTHIEISGQSSICM